MYAPYLQSARCICRSVIRRFNKVDKCCSSASAAVAAARSSAYSTSHEHHPNSRQQDRLVPRHHARAARNTCTPCKEPDIKSCSSHEDLDEVLEVDVKAEKTESGMIDLEEASGLSHILLNVTGMDCSGCANNMTRALRSAPGTKNVQCVFINSTAEFDLNVRVNTLENVIRHAQRATGYKATPFLSDTQTLDVLVDADEAKRFQENLPRGVDSCQKVSKTTYEVSYDPCVIGARTVLTSMGNAELAPPRGDGFLDQGRRRLVWVAALTTASFIFTMPVVVLEWVSPPGISEHTILIIALVLTTFVQAIAVSEFYKPAISALIYNKVVEMDMLVVISITAAYGYSIIAFSLIFAGRDLETEPFFETSTLLITLILLGRLLAAWARKRAVSAVSVRSLQAATATLFDPSSGATVEIDARLIQFGDTIKIQPHSQIVTDADVLDGTSEVDESMLTGESLPVLKTAGSPIVSGTINGSGALTARVSRLPGKNTITDIANLVERAQSSKPRVQDLADKVASYFIPVVVTASLIVLVIWIVVGLKVRNQSADKVIGTAIGYWIAVLAVSCPCALGLAVPIVLVVAGGLAARGGVIIKTGDVIERGYRVTDVVFDKTGTLTQPHLEVVQEELFPVDGIDRATAFSLVMAMVKDNKHPVSEAVTACLKKHQISGVKLQNSKSTPGCGVEAMWNGLIVRAGNAKWLDIRDRPEVVNFVDRGLTMLCVTLESDLVAVFGLKSVLRPEAASVAQELHRRHIAVHIVSGDATKVVEGVAAELGIPGENVAAERKPAQKQEYIKQLMDNGKITLFCGDGTNDAVAVAQANVGVQIESSSDVTRATADVVLLSNLEGVVDLLDVSKSAFRRIIFNFCWSATYNVLAILLAGGAFVKIRIAPAYAGLGEIVSVMPVIVAALTMPKVKRGSNKVMG